jgi:hypothetical protein
MADTGFIVMGTVEQNADGEAWSNLTSAQTDHAGSIKSGTQSATCFFDDTTTATPNSATLKLRNGAFSGISGTINGIEVAIDMAQGSGNDGRDTDVRLIKAGSIGGTQKATSTVVNTSSNGETRVYGGAADLWGRSWVAADFASTFGVALMFGLPGGFGNSSTMYVDCAKIKVYYTPAASTNPLIVGWEHMKGGMKNLGGFSNFVKHRSGLWVPNRRIFLPA